MIDLHHGWNRSYKPVFIGYVASLILIITIYLLLDYHPLTGRLLVFTVFGSAITQALIQLVFFLHLGMESKPHWFTITFLFAVLVIIIIVGGSLWIMTHLNYNLMPNM